MMDNRKKYNLFQAIISAVCINMVLEYLHVSIYSLVFLFIFYSIFSYVDNHCKKDKYTKICSVVFSIFVTMGMVDYWWLSEVSRIEKIMRLCFVILGSYYVIYYILRLFFTKYDDAIDAKRKIKCNLSENTIFVLTFIIIALIWSVTWLADYPAVIGPDTVSQIMQIMGDIPLDNFNPLANTLWIKLQYMLLQSFGITNINVIFGIMSLVQLLIMDAIVSFQVRLLYKKTNSLFLFFFSVAFYTIVAYHASFSVTVGKDTVFSIVVLAFLLLILILFEHKEERRHNGIYLVGLFVVGIMVNLFRGNGYYAYAFFLVFAIIYGIKNKEKNFTLTIALAFLVSSIIIGPVYKSFEVVERPYVEGLSIPVQQIAYVVASGEKISEDDYRLLSQIVDVEQMASEYTEWISDPVKQLFTSKNYFMDHKLDFLRLWIKLGVQYPKQYFVAYVKQTCGYWYPAVETWPYDMGVTENPYGIKHMPILSDKIVDQIEILAYKYLETPLYGSFWCIATYTWGVVCMFIYSLRRKNKVVILNYAFLMGIWIGLLICTPVHATFRYIYPLVIAFPLILFMPYAECDLEDKSGTTDCE